MNRALVDSSAFLSLADPDEPSHARVARAVDDLLGGGYTLLTTNFVFDETYTLILTRLSRRSAVAWGNSVHRSEIVELVRVDEDHERQAWDMLLNFDDRELSYTHATSFAVAASLKINVAVAVDRHFDQYGHLRILPESRG